MKKKLIASLVTVLMITTFNYQTIFAQSEISVIKTSEVSVAANKQTIAEQKVQALVNPYGATSVQYALMDDGEIVLSGNAGVYSKSENTALTAQTMYGIGSISKMYTTTAVMKLVDMGKVDLDTPVVTYIPEFKMVDERYKAITPRMLLNHSSGLMGSSMTSSMLFEDNDAYAHDNLLKHLSEQRLKANPGEFSVYCNDGFTLAEILVEKVSGMDFTGFIHKYITEPLGLENTKTPMDVFATNQLAKNYGASGIDELPVENVNVIGAGGIYSTAEELCKFANIFTGQAEGILSKESVKAMENPEYKNGLWIEEADNVIGYGLGWDSVDLYPFNQYGIKALVKGGDTLGFHGSLVVLPEYNMSAAVVSSGSNSSYNQIVASEILMEALKEKGVITEVKPKGNFGTPMQVVVEEEMMKYEGVYSAGMNQLMSIDMTPEGLLSLTLVGMEGIVPAQTFSYIGAEAFVSGDGSTHVEFVEEKNGHTYLEMKQYAEVPGIGTMAQALYAGQKMESNKLSEDVKAVWNKRNGKSYFVVNEKYTSISNSMMVPVVGIMETEALPGYIGDSKIVDANYAKNVLQMPIMSGRDLKDISFYEENGMEYVKLEDILAINQDSVGPLAIGKSTCTIKEDGYARWYTVPSEMAGKTINVTMPSNGAFAVYDQNGLCVHHSLVTGENTVILPENGYIVFMGDKGVGFEIGIK